MTLPGVISGRNLVIASTSSSQGEAISPIFIISDESPTERPNGGDLVVGDWWYSSNGDLQFWDGGEWNPVEGSELTEVQQTLEQHSEQIKNLYDMIESMSPNTQSKKIKKITKDIANINIELGDINNIINELLKFKKEHE